MEVSIQAVLAPFRPPPSWAKAGVDTIRARTAGPINDPIFRIARIIPPYMVRGACLWRVLGKPPILGDQTCSVTRISPIRGRSLPLVWGNLPNKRPKRKTPRTKIPGRINRITFGSVNRAVQCGNLGFGDGQGLLCRVFFSIVAGRAYIVPQVGDRFLDLGAVQILESDRVIGQNGAALGRDFGEPAGRRTHAR